MGPISPTLSNSDIETCAERFLASLIRAEGTIENKTGSSTKLFGTIPDFSKDYQEDYEIWLKQYVDLADARAFFDLTVGNLVIPHSTIEGITYRKRPSLTRLTPTLAEFKAVVADLRSEVSNIHGAENSAVFVSLPGLNAGAMKFFRQRSVSSSSFLPSRR
ncbi:hypothetical protein BH09VER1_BH09VER1_07120 [soil metagenome]